MTRYDDFLKEVFAWRTHHQKKNSLSLIQEGLQTLGDPHLAYPTIHVAGTNGKGQVCTSVAHALTQSGYKTALFTSPHLFHYEERMQIDGKNIPQDTLLDLYHLLKEKGLCQPPINFFELSCLIAFSYFAHSKVDVAVIETGLGGLYDSTNVVRPHLSVITSIDLDHTDVLGNTLEEIAFQKAGIIKPHTPLVLGPTAQLPLVTQRAKEMSAPLYCVEERGRFSWEENRAIARKALLLLQGHFALTEEAITEGLHRLPPCRFERRGDVVYDVAHNPIAFIRLRDALQALFPGRSFRFVVGLVPSKDLRGCLEQIEPLAAHLHYVEAPPFAPCNIPLKCPVSREPSIHAAMQKALALRRAQEMVVVCGSFQLMKAAQEAVS